MGFAGWCCLQDAMCWWRSRHPFSIFMCVCVLPPHRWLVPSQRRRGGRGPRVPACSVPRRQRRRRGRGRGMGRDRESEGEQSRGGRLIEQGEEERMWRTTLIEHSRSHGAYQRGPSHTHTMARRPIRALASLTHPPSYNCSSVAQQMWGDAVGSEPVSHLDSENWKSLCF